MNQPIGIPSGWETVCAFFWDAVRKTSPSFQVRNIIHEVAYVEDWSLWTEEPHDWRVED